MNNLNRLTFFISLSLYFFACTGQKTTMTESYPPDAGPTVADMVLEIPFPEIPDSMTSSTDKASYLIKHFWDTVDFSNHELSGDDSFMEQNFVNFVYVYPYADHESRKTATRSLLIKASEDSIALSKVINISDQYLFDPESPMRNDSLYSIFLSEELALLDFPDYEREWRELLLTLASRNNPGHKATDFTFELSDGSETSLYKLSFKGDLLVYFYNPDCDKCEKATKLLITSPQIEDMIDKEKLSLLAVAATDDRERWQTAIKKMPATWIHAIDYGNTDDELLYDLRALPSLYRLDRKLNVIFKDMPIL